MLGAPAVHRSVDATERLLGQLDTEERRVLLAHHAFGWVRDDLRCVVPHRTVDEVALLLESAEAKVGPDAEAVGERLGPLLDRSAVRTGVGRGALALVAGCVVVATVALVVVAAGRSAPAATVVASSTSTSVVPATTAAPTTATTAPSPAIDPDDYREPDRELEIVVSDDDTILRLEPWTRRVIWESRPFTEPMVLSVDINTVAITSNGNRVILNLVDGTQLPP